MVVNTHHTTQSKFYNDQLPHLIYPLIKFMHLTIHLDKILFKYEIKNIALRHLEGLHFRTVSSNFREYMYLMISSH